MIRACRIQLKRIFTIRTALLGIAAGVLYALSIAGLYKESQDAWYLIFQSTQSGIQFLTVFFIPPMVFAYTLAEEWENKAADYYVIRSGLRKYVFSKYAAAAAGGFLCLFIGMGLFAAACCIMLPPFIHSNNSSIYDTMMGEGTILKGYLLFIIDQALSGAVTAVIGMTVSTYIMTPLTGVVAPLCVEISFSLLSYIIRLPSVMDPNTWVRIYNGEAVSGLLTQRVLPVLIAMIVMTLIGEKRMERRLTRG